MKIKNLVIVFFLLIYIICPSYVFSENLEYDINYQKGVISMQHKHYNDAIYEFEKVIEKYSQSRPFATLLAEVYYQNGIKNFNEKNYKKSTNDFRIAIFYLKYFLPATAIEQEKAAKVLSCLNNSIKKEELSLSSQNRFNLARNLEKKCLFKQAIVEYLLAAEDPYISSISLKNAGNLFETLNLLKNASECYDKTLKIDPLDYDLHFKNATVLEKLGKTTRAIEEYKLSIQDENIPYEISLSLERLAFTNLAKYPQNPKSYLDVGDIYKSKNDFISALEYYEKAKKLAPNDIIVKIKMGELYQAQNQTMKALEVFNEIIKNHPDYNFCYIARARLYKKINKFENALFDYKRALLVDKNNKILMEEVLEFLSENKEINKLKIYEEIKNQLSNENFDIAYAEELLKNKLYSQALLEYQKIIDKNRGNIRAYIQKSSCYEILFDFENAIKTLDTGILNNPSDKKLPAIKVEILQKKNEILYLKANSFLEKSSYLDALKIYLQIGDPSKEVLVKIGECYEKTNNLSKAYEYYERAFWDDCNYIPCIKKLCDIYISKNQFEKALEFAQKGTILEPDSVYFKDKIIEIKKIYHEKLLKCSIEDYNKMNYKKALKNLNIVLELNPQNPYGYYYKALCYDALNDSLSAISNYEKILNLQDEDVKLIPTIYYSLAIDYDTIAEYNKAKESYKKFIDISGTAENEFTKYAKKRLRELSKKPKI